ncbi:MAG: hypothetical protein IK085_11290 [Clostridia bacterium]|nr:hypothetical protein [Clostridia bacterium]
MTQKLYYFDAYMSEFSADVVSCEATEKGFAVVLDKTAFFPEGGGQPADTGFINSAAVIDVQEVDGIIYHYCSEEFEAGENVGCSIDFDKRFLNMQLHSGEHVFSGYIHQLTGFDNVGFHMGESAVTVDFNGVVTPEILSQAERLANEAVWNNLEIETICPADDELENYDYRSKKEIDGQVRLVRIEDADLCACCGTHVHYTGEIGMIKAVAMQNYKNGVRITLHAGARALEDYDAVNKSIRAAGALLAAKPSEVPAGVEHLLEKLDLQKAVITDLRLKLNAVKCEKIEPGTPYYLEIITGGDAKEAQKLCDMICEKALVGAVFGESDEGIKYCIASRETDVRPIGEALNNALDGRGGGRAEMVQGSLPCNIEKACKSWAKITAEPENIESPEEIPAE